MNSYETAKKVEQNLIAEHKDAIDKRTRCCNSIIMEEKCERCGKVHPRVLFLWGISITDGYPALLIRVPCLDEARIKDVYEVEKALSRIGIHFDTGYGGLRDWEFDWSLYGIQSVRYQGWNSKELNRQRKGKYNLKCGLRKLVWRIYLWLC